MNECELYSDITFPCPCKHIQALLYEVAPLPKHHTMKVYV